MIGRQCVTVYHTIENILISFRINKVLCMASIKNLTFHLPKIYEVHQLKHLFYKQYINIVLCKILGCYSQNCGIL